MILILTPLPLELKVLGQSLPSRKDVVLKPGGHGKVEFALSTQHWIRELSPRLVICAGSCGSLVSTVAPLDVIVATHTVEHDFRLQFIERPLPSFSGHEPSLSLLRERRWDFPVHFGGIASGDEDVLSRDRSGEIAQSTGAAGVAWEGAGGARACARTRTPFLEVRGVTDLADHHSRDEFARHLAAAMVRVGLVLEHLL